MLCNYQKEKYEWYMNNSDITDFIKITCYQNYDAYIQNKINELYLEKRKSNKESELEG